MEINTWSDLKNNKEKIENPKYKSNLKLNQDLKIGDIEFNNCKIYSNKNNITLNADIIYGKNIKFENLYFDAELPIEANNVVFKNVKSPHFRLNRVNDIKIINSYFMNINMFKSKDIKIKNSIFCEGLLNSLKSCIEIENSENIKINDCELFNSERGIYVYNSNNILIKKIKIQNASLESMIFDHDTKNIKIIDSKVKDVNNIFKFEKTDPSNILVKNLSPKRYNNITCNDNKDKINFEDTPEFTISKI